jgi:hypothetical protein
MRRNDAIDTLREHQRELNALGVQRVAVTRCWVWCGCSGR